MTVKGADIRFRDLIVGNKCRTTLSQSHRRVFMLETPLVEQLRLLTPRDAAGLVCLMGPKDAIDVFSNRALTLSQRAAILTSDVMPADVFGFIANEKLGIVSYPGADFPELSDAFSIMRQTQRTSVQTPPTDYIQRLMLGGPRNYPVHVVNEMASQCTDPLTRVFVIDYVREMLAREPWTFNQILWDLPAQTGLSYMFFSQPESHEVDTMLGFASGLLVYGDD